MAKAVETPAVFVVLDSFVGQLDGVEVFFRKGDTVDPGHPAIKKWPSSFGPLAVTHPHQRAASPRIEQATAGPGEKRGA